VARRLFLHIGAPKSGTTYLQSMVWANADALRSVGLLVPGQDQFDAFYATLQVRGSSRQHGLPARAFDAWPRLLDQVRSWDGDALISHEFFAATPAARVPAVVADTQPAQLHVVYTMRDYVGQIPALWQETVKVGSTNGLRAFAASMLAGNDQGPLSWRTIDAVAVLDRWLRHVPPAHVHVVTVPPPGSPRDLLWRRFATVLGVRPSAATAPATRSNQSLGAVEVELLRRVNERLQPPLTRSGAPRYRWVRRYLAETVLVSRRGARFGLHPEDAEAVRARGLEAVAQLRSRNVHVEGDLADVVAEPIGASTPDPDAASTDELLDAAVSTIADLVARHRKDVIRLERRGTAGPNDAGNAPPQAVHDSGVPSAMRRRLSRNRRLARRALGG
jgi:hypothetical protein